MLIGICSDSHDHVSNIQTAVSFFRDREVAKVVHAGDYCSPFTLPLFEGLPLHGVLGNNDGDIYLLMKKFESVGAVLHGPFFSFELDEVTFAVYHGTVPEITESLELCGKYDVVITGHTHEPRLDTIGNTLSINPGSINGFDGDAMVALFDTNTRKVQFKELQ